MELSVEKPKSIEKLYDAKTKLRKIESKHGRIKYFLMEGDEQVRSCIELMSIYVNPQFRRQGHGMVLIKKLIEVAKKENVNCIYTKVTKENEAFRKFLGKNGFTISPKKMLFQKKTPLTFRRVLKRLRRACG